VDEDGRFTTVSVAQVDATSAIYPVDYKANNNIDDGIVTNIMHVT